MNLVDGKLISSAEKQNALDRLPEKILDTLSQEHLAPSVAVDALDALSKSFDRQEYVRLLVELGYDRRMAENDIGRVERSLCKENLLYRLKNELGVSYGQTREFIPPDCAYPVHEKILPLGVLLHIAAGNADGLPVFSVMEGLLTGNINILKLPQVGDILSEKIIMQLLQIEPRLANYLYVFDYTSREVEAMKKLIHLSDAVVIWGSDAAVSAVRRMAKPDTKLIEWGNKISFAYVTKEGMNEEDLTSLARHICETNQIPCSSCRGVFLDTDSMQDVTEFCEKFLEILDGVSKTVPFHQSIASQAQITLELYNDELEGKTVFRKGNVTLTVLSDRKLEAGRMFRNCWVKPLPRNELLKTVRPYKNRLQTVGLLCSEEERASLADLLFHSGAVRVTTSERMSEVFCGAPHDGEYSLRRYTKAAQMF